MGHHALTAVADYYASRRAAPAGRAIFADLTYRYTLPTVRKIDLEARWNHVFDARQYQDGVARRLALVQRTYQLRPTQVRALVRASL